MKFLLSFVLYFIVLAETIPLAYSQKSSSFLKVRPIYQKAIPSLWVNVPLLGGVTSISTDDIKNEMYFEFQDIRNGNITKTNPYTLWDYSLLYKDYVDLINQRLKPT